MWFFVTVVIQNFFLSAPYGRNWTCKFRYATLFFSSTNKYICQVLWTSQHAKHWQVTLLVLFFFGVVWVGMMGECILYT